jgi:aldehyde dehydrogenase family protein
MKIFGDKFSMEHRSLERLSSLPPDSSRDELERALQDLRSAKSSWASVALAERMALLEEIIKRSSSVYGRLVSFSLKAKGLDEDSIGAAQEIIAGPYVVVRGMRRLLWALRDIEARGAPRVPGPVTARPNGQVVARVVPQDVYDRIFFPGITMEVWMQPGVTLDNLAQTQATAYHQKGREGKVALVLGGGNVSGIPPTDTLYKLFVENQVVLLKMNPVNAYIGPLLEEWFLPLIERGFLRIVYGDAEVGEYLCFHRTVEEVWVTGSDKTFDSIVFGSGKKETGTVPRLSKPIVGELGNICPVIVVPGPWSAADLAYHAELVASGVTENAGFTCSIPRLILQYPGWEKRRQFLDELRTVLSRTPLRDAYYPGAKERRNEFLAHHPEAESFGAPGGSQLPWTMVANLDTKNVDDICFQKEAFFGFVAEAGIDAPDTSSFIERAVKFVNEHVWGTLTAIILVHPVSLRDPSVAAAMERAIGGLRYGTIAVNYIAGANWAAGVTPWGAFPNDNIYDIQSGNGFVHNSLMFSKAQKTVIRAPFRLRPKPVWFSTRGKAANEVFGKILDFEIQPSAGKVAGILWSALR